MPDASGHGDGAPRGPQDLPPTAGLEDSGSGRELAVEHRVGWGFITLYAAAYMGTTLVLIAPLLVTLALKINALVGIEQAPYSLAWSPGSARCWRWSEIRSSAS